ncbi:MAG: glycosyltransferase family 4 protein [Thermoplasmata archaeon]|nr:glycosyltransferase family 4 protein [Thermoplasmata archaeon]
MRIAIMTDSFYPTTDGVAVAVRVTKEALEAMGHEVFVLAPDPGREEDRLPGVRYFPSVKFRKYEGYYLPILPSNQTEIIEEIKPDVIHIRGVAIMALKALFASHNTHVPTVLTYDTVVTEVIGMYSPVKLPKETLARLATVYLRKMLKRPNAIAVPTPSTGRELEAMGVKPRMLEVVPTGIDTDRFRFSQEGRDTIRARYGLDGSRVVLFVGRLSFEKNVDLLIRSLPLMEPDVRLLIVGDGPARESLEKAVDDTGVRDRVTFTGYIHGDELVYHYSAADAFVSPSVFETQGFTVQEAMSAGLVAACGNGRAFTDFIRDGENGYLFDLDEKSCAAAAMNALSAPKEVRDASMETALSYGIRPCTEKLVALYEKVIESRRQQE